MRTYLLYMLVCTFCTIDATRSENKQTPKNNLRCATKQEALQAEQQNAIIKRLGQFSKNSRQPILKKILPTALAILDSEEIR